ncbi:UNVERIFIED_CONTAM: hypothetical protein K2H54_040375 [Gekko kuhli]
MKRGSSGETGRASRAQSACSSTARLTTSTAVTRKWGDAYHGGFVGAESGYILSWDAQICEAVAIGKNLKSRSSFHRVTTFVSLQPHSGLHLPLHLPPLGLSPSPSRVDCIGQGTAASPWLPGALCSAATPPPPADLERRAGGPSLSSAILSPLSLLFPRLNRPSSFSLSS